MQIKETRKYLGNDYLFEYSDCDDFSRLPKNQCTQVYGVCFLGNKIVIGFRKKQNEWGLIGGTIENNEPFEKTLKREIKEESNMEVTSYSPIGYQKITELDGKQIYQLRYCCKVNKLGKFVKDPDDNIVKIKLINPLEYKKYFDWGKIGDRIIQRAMELKKNL